MKSITTMKQKIHAGFTVIELMIVVAIIGILAAVAIPKYMDYAIQAKVGNALTSAAPLQTAVAMCVQENSSDPAKCSTGSDGIPAFTPTKEVAAAQVDKGVIVLTFGSGVGRDVDGKTITMKPVLGSTALTWNITTTVGNEAAAATITKNSMPLNGVPPSTPPAA